MPVSRTSMCSWQRSAPVSPARVPVTEIEDVRYENGQIRFDTRGKNQIHMSGKDADGKTSAALSQADGERFVAAVKARQQYLATPR